MDTTTLVSDLTDEGKKIIDQLLQHGFDVTAAFWLKKTEDGKWRYYIVSPVTESNNKPYGQLYTLTMQMELNWIDPFTVKLLGPGNPIAKEVLAIHAAHTGKKSRPIHWSGPTLGNVSIEGAYLYPLPALAAA